MADVHVPKLEKHGKSLFKILLEVSLISVGVFLGLIGEQWRENARHRELAKASLERFRTELTANRKAVADVKDYHADRLKELDEYFKVKPRDRAKAADRVNIPHGINPAFLEHSAWDLALATQSLSYIDADLGVSLSSVYNQQSALAGVQQAFLNGIFAHPPPVEDPSVYFGEVMTFCSDAVVFEPRLMAMYDDLLPRLDKAIAAE